MVSLDLPSRQLLNELLEESAARHEHLCPRQVLGVRLGLFGLKKLGFAESVYQKKFDNHNKRVLTIVETDGCGADGIAVATNCSVGRRTLRVMDFGKVAATLIDAQSGRAVRLAPWPDARQSAVCKVTDAPSRWHAYLIGYQEMSDEALFQVKEVELTESLADIISSPDKRVVCDDCGEEIFNEREVELKGRLLCRPCAGINVYWR